VKWVACCLKCSVRCGTWSEHYACSQSFWHRDMWLMVGCTTLWLRLWSEILIAVSVHALIIIPRCRNIRNTPSLQFYVQPCGVSPQWTLQSLLSGRPPLFTSEHNEWLSVSQFRMVLLFESAHTRIRPRRREISSLLSYNSSAFSKLRRR
jgi:hypothetical protein